MPLENTLFLIYLLIFFTVILREQKDKTMADKLMYKPNDHTQNYPF